MQGQVQSPSVPSPTITESLPVVANSVPVAVGVTGFRTFKELRIANERGDGETASDYRDRIDKLFARQADGLRAAGAASMSALHSAGFFPVKCQVAKSGVSASMRFRKPAERKPAALRDVQSILDAIGKLEPAALAKVQSEVLASV